MGFMNEFENLKQSFEKEYNDIDNTISTEAYRNILKRSAKLLVKLKSEDLNMFQEFLTKRKLTKIREEVTSAKKLTAKIYTYDEDSRELLDQLENNTEVKIVGTNMRSETVTVTKNAGTYTIDTDVLFKHLPHGTFETKNKREFDLKFNTLCDDTLFKLQYKD